MVDLQSLHLSERAARDLGFAEVQRVLSSLCATPFGREALQDEVFPRSLALLGERGQEAMEAALAVERRVAPDFGAVRDIRPALVAARKGTVLGTLDLLDVARTQDGLGRLHDVMGFQGVAAPRLSALGRSIAEDRRFAKRVLRSIDEQGQLADDASPELGALRQKVRALRVEAQARLGALIREYDDAGVLRDRNFTVRNDRYVLPVKSEFQARVDGIVHDASQTHQTVFVEPRALLQIGNSIKIAGAEVEQEEQRILAELSAEVAELAPRLSSDLAHAGHIEAAFARGAFAARTGGRLVELSTDVPLALRKARHPLLAWRKSETERAGQASPAVVGNDISLGRARALVVSGPNAGGKTVALKTAGLIALLARAGIPAPVAEDSSVAPFAAVACVIGDAQSLEGALSSFSGHLVLLREVLAEVDEHRQRGPVLCLLDELLAGTDPGQGAALGQALLEHLVEQGAFVVATTHYERLKALAMAGGSFRNASVALDPAGRPTFHLALDQAGTSNALDAARRYGLPDKVIARADALQSPDDKEFSGMLRALSEERAALAERLRDAEQAKAMLAANAEGLERRIAEVTAEGQRLRREGLRAFAEELAAARREVAKAIEATKAGADARTLNAISHGLQELEQRAHVEARSPFERARPSSVAVGEAVEVESLPGTRLVVLEVDGDDVVLSRGAVKMRVKKDALRTPTPDKGSGRGKKKS
ncbi:MAG: hypothetical protein IT383_01650 [Deltaproteobacteria bacterium]|nr:hypothetical protein [Deltaproteobacteria bacterium]